jgi:hypothetical protein
MSRAFCSAMAFESSTIFFAFDSRAIQNSGASFSCCTPTTACGGMAMGADDWFAHDARKLDASNAQITCPLCVDFIVMPSCPSE